MMGCMKSSAPSNQDSRLQPGPEPIRAVLRCCHSWQSGAALTEMMQLMQVWFQAGVFAIGFEPDLILADSRGVTLVFNGQPGR